MRISESPSIPAFFLHLIGLGCQQVLWSIVPLIVSWGGNSYLRLKERRSPGTKGERQCNTCGGQIYSGQVRSGQLYGQGRYGSTRLQRLDRRISSYVWFAGAA